METLANRMAQFLKTEQIRALQDHFNKVEKPEEKVNFVKAAHTLVVMLENESNPEKVMARCEIINQLLNKEVGHE